MGNDKSQRTYSQRQLRVGEMVKQNLGELFIRDEAKIPTINSKLITVTDSMESKYIESVNSVHYFSTLPYSLNDQAVQKKLLNEVKINGKEYYKIEISFSPLENCLSIFESVNDQVTVSK